MFESGYLCSLVWVSGTSRVWGEATCAPSRPSRQPVVLNGIRPFPIRKRVRLEPN